MSNPNDDTPNVSDVSRATTSSSTRSNASTLASLRRKVLAHQKDCKTCRKFSIFPEDRNELVYHVALVKKHFLQDPHRNVKKRPAAESSSAEKPAAKTRMHSPESVSDVVTDVVTEEAAKVPQKLTIKPKSKDHRTLSFEQSNTKNRDSNETEKMDNEAIVIVHSDREGVNAFCPENQMAKSTGAISKEQPNELRSMECLDSIHMETNEENSPPTPILTKNVDLRKFVANNSPTEFAVPTRNRFEPLRQIPAEDQPAVSTSSAIKDKAAEAPRKQAAKPVRPATPPPIVIVGTDENNITLALDRVTSGDYWLKYTANSIIVHTKNTADYEAVLRACNEVSLHYHTYSAAGRKTHAFVLRGMANRHTPEEVAEDLRKNTILNAQKVFKMRTIGAPLFLVVTDASWTVSKLNREIPRVLRVGIQWENRRSANPITQCRRCQLWGHSMGNCRRTLRCSKCAEPHEITQCQHVGKPKCANCKGEHRAFSRECPVYQQKLAQYLEKFPQAAPTKPSYVPAPMPTNPAWSPNRGLYTTGPNTAPPQNAQAPPPATTQDLYNRNFPAAPGNRRNASAQAQPQRPAPTAAPAGVSATSSFQILKGKWDEVNALVNFDNMIKALDIYVSMLRSASSNEELFNVSREFFCHVLPSINLAP